MALSDRYNQPYLSPGNEFEPGAMVVRNRHTPGESTPCAVLSVTDVERLAKAGVKMEWETMRDQVRPDPAPSNRRHP